MRYLCFRFDVDTHKCLRDGVPNLLQLARYHKVKFTFFLNVGQAIDRLHFFQSKIKKKPEKDIKSLSPLTKLGLKDYLFLSLANPSIGERYSENIKLISKLGHEIGLHGGKNHQNWFFNAKKWTSKNIENELRWGIQILKNLGQENIWGFSSPGWNGSAKIDKALHKLGFQYSSDIYSSKPLEKITYSKGIIQIPTNIVGEPGGVGYLEHCRASGLSDLQIMQDFKDKLVKRKRLSVIYDHPFYVGVKEINILGKMIKLAKNMNINIITMKEVLNKK